MTDQTATPTNALTHLLSGVKAQLHDDDPAAFHGDNGPGDCPRCAPAATTETPVQGPTEWTPDHYRGAGMQPFDVINAFGLDFYEGNVLKYLLRWRRKNGVEDLCKARTYLQVLIDQQQPATDNEPTTKDS